MFYGSNDIRLVLSCIFNGKIYCGFVTKNLAPVQNHLLVNVLYTEFPTGLFVAWTWIELNMQCVVYPKPVASAALPAGNSMTDGETVLHADGLEEYTGLRKYQAGDSWRRVSWKASARSDEVYTKEFAGGQPELQWIEWKAITASGTEARLSIMTRLVMDAEAGQRYYGLRMPNIELSPDHGNRHYLQCLKTLALYGNE